MFCRHDQPECAHSGMDLNHCFTGILGPISLLDPRIQQDPINLLAKPLADGQPKDIVVLFGSAKPSGGMALCDYFLFLGFLVQSIV